MKEKRLSLLAAAAMTALPTLPVYANVGLPMLAVYWPPAVLLLPAVVGVEALVGIRKYNVPYRQAIVSQAVANGISTLVGVPLMWASVAIAQIQLLMPAWRPKEPDCFLQATVMALWVPPPVRACGWVVPIALVVATLTFFLMSTVSEYVILRRLHRALPASAVRGWALASNAVSYALLAILVAARGYSPSTFAWAMEPIEALLFGAVDGLLALVAGRG